MAPFVGRTSFGRAALQVQETAYELVRAILETALAASACHAKAAYSEWGIKRVFGAQCKVSAIPYIPRASVHIVRNADA